MIKTKWDGAYILGIVDEVIRDFPSELWKYRSKYKFGISKALFDQYYKKWRGKAALIHFKEIRMIYPPLKKFPKYQTWGYITIPSSTKTYELLNERIRKIIIELTNEVKQTYVAPQKRKR